MARQAARTTPLNDLQIELLKLYSTDLTPEELRELKQQLANFFAAKAIRTADQVWDKRGLSNEEMDSWLHG